MAEFTRVLGTADLSLGEMRIVDLDGEEVVVASVDGVFCAFSNLCSHEGGPLGEGELDGDVVTCPWHFTRFNVRTGEVIDGVTDEPVPTYEVHAEGGDVMLRKS